MTELIDQFRYNRNQINHMRGCAFQRPQNSIEQDPVLCCNGGLCGIQGKKQQKPFSPSLMQSPQHKSPTYFVAITCVTLPPGPFTNDRLTVSVLINSSVSEVAPSSRLGRSLI